MALITGGARRLGKHMALALAHEGYDVVITYNHSAKDAQRTVVELKKLGSDSIALRAEVSKKAQVEKIIAQIGKKYGRLDVLIGNAGMYPEATPLEKVTEKLFDDTIATNLKGNFLFGQAASALMKKNNKGENKTGGRIVFMASLGGLQIWKDRLPYNVSKAGVIALTKAMARALAADGISVNAIAPGHIEMNDEPGAVPTFGSERVPMGRFGTPDDIVRAMLFFVNSATYITGEILAVDGGIHLKG
ncbi:MAG TPA: SDR family NAD(P)-dependent oxidoreductase [Candidatus Kapabacteria bacterium]|nr:SDR family NAD(P)-dependent oxidoreductase [Candidatus Kapabacteria bacterium]